MKTVVNQDEELNAFKLGIFGLFRQKVCCCSAVVVAGGNVVAFIDRVNLDCAGSCLRAATSVDDHAR